MKKVKSIMKKIRSIKISGEGFMMLYFFPAFVVFCLTYAILHSFGLVP